MASVSRSRSSPCWESWARSLPAPCSRRGVLPRLRLPSSPSSRKRRELLLANRLVRADRAREAPERDVSDELEGDVRGGRALFRLVAHEHFVGSSLTLTEERS